MKFSRGLAGVVTAVLLGSVPGWLAAWRARA